MMARLIVCCCIIYFSLFLKGCSEQGFPRDKDLLLNFKNNKESYIQIVGIFLSREIYRFEIMSNGNVNVRPKVEVNESLLRKLVEKNISINLVGSVGEKDDYKKTKEISFFHYRRGLVFSGEHKGVVYVVDDKVEQLVTQLDEIDRNNVSLYQKRLYKNIAPHWYIFYEYFP